MKIPEKLEIIIVDFINGSQVSYIPVSKVDEYEDCYEFLADSEVEGQKKKMIVLLRHSIKSITFVSK